MGLLEQLRAALGDRYRVEQEVGRGGMAIVFLAHDLKHRRPVAIKLLKPELSAVLGGERFLREIEIAATLQHPHILPLYDSGQAGGLVWYVMPFVEGESLRQRLVRDGPLPIDQALRVAQEVGSALEYAHGHGIVHRDIKPENILMFGDQAVVADFGIARALHAAESATLTQTGLVVGTPQYMSPEQAVGGVVDGRSDQYSLACTLYEMLTGQPPFVGPNSQAVIARHTKDPVPSLRALRQTVPAGVEQAVVQAMAKMPADRFLSMEWFLDALRSAGTGELGAARRSRSRSRWIALAILALAALAAVAVWWFLTREQAPSQARPSVAVLPFQDLANDSASSFLGEGMTEGLLADLAGVGSIKVISRESGAAAQGARSFARLATELGVDAVVTGSYQRASDTVVVRVRLLRAPDSTVLFAHDYRTGIGKLPDLQREVAVAITTAVKAKLEGSERTRLSARGEVNQRAYEAYLRGRFYLDQGEGEQARPFFEEASRIAPAWAPPYVGMANYYSSLPFFSDVSPADVLPKAREMLSRALELDETLAEAHAANAYIRAYYEWDWRAAEREFRRAIELRPNYADAYFSYSRFLASRRRLDEAIAQLGRAVELDPLSVSLQANRALLDYFAGRYPEAETRLREALTRDSTDVTAKWGLALVAEQQGKLDEAITILEAISGTSPLRRSSLAHAYATAGKTTQARAVLASLREQASQRYVPSYWFALIHAGLGEKDQALRELERAYEERSTVLAYLLIDPRLKPLREDPRFVALARRMGGD
jgi:serine/threonine-protein kinase